MHIVTPVMFALISANVVNAISNWVFIYGNWGAPAMGVPGAAWATFVSRVYMMAVLLLGRHRRLRSLDVAQVRAPAEELA
jgi:multidrug resistance protein, MATE family